MHTQLKGKKARRKLLAASVDYGTPGLVLKYALYLEAHAEVVDPGDMEVDAARGAASHLAEVAVETASQTAFTFGLEGAIHAESVDAGVGDPEPSTSSPEGEEVPLSTVQR